MFENGCRVYLILLQTVTQALSIYFTVIFLAVQNKVGIANPGSQIDLSLFNEYVFPLKGIHHCHYPVVKIEKQHINCTAAG